MNPIHIRKRLESASFRTGEEDLPVQDESILSMHLNADMELWCSEDRFVVLKSYTSNHHFLLNWREDQFVISHLLEILPSQYKNNLYYLLVLDWDSALLPEMPLEINRVEKNAKVCRKYVIQNLDDLERVPFLQSKNKHNNSSYNFEDQFKKELYEKQTLDPTLRRVVEGFFKMEQMDRGHKKFDTKQYIYSLLKGDALL